MTLEQFTFGAKSVDTDTNDSEYIPQHCAVWESWFLMDDGTYECITSTAPIDPSDQPAWSTMPGLVGFVAV